MTDLSMTGLISSIRQTNESLGLSLAEVSLMVKNASTNGHPNGERMLAATALYLHTLENLIAPNLQRATVEKLIAVAIPHSNKCPKRMMGYLLDRSYREEINSHFAFTIGKAAVEYLLLFEKKETILEKCSVISEENMQHGCFWVQYHIQQMARTCNTYIAGNTESLCDLVRVCANILVKQDSRSMSNSDNTASG